MRTIANSILEMKSSRQGVAVKFKQKGRWEEYTWAEYFNQIEKVAYSLLAIGILPKDKIAIMSNTRLEWAVTDLSILGIKAVTVPVYPNNTPEDTEFILNNSEAKILFIENKTLIKVWKKIKANCPHIKQVISFEYDSPEDQDVIPWHEFKEKGSSLKKENKNTFFDLLSKIEPTDEATILYTSGTTGQPKGVLLTHEQIYSEVSEAFPSCGLTKDDICLSFLPYAHILGRVDHLGQVFIGHTLAFAESIEKIKNNLVEIKPTILVSVPRIFEKIYSGIWTQMETQPLKLKLFKWAIEVGTKVSHLKLTYQTIPVKLLIEFELAKKLVLNKITEAFGGRLRFAISGGAPMSREIALFFHSAGILILEGYGLTETTAAICVNTPFNYKFGSVGRPIGDTEIKIANDGEILVKSKKVMKQYYKNPEATNEVFTDGYFHTGDIGEFLAGGDLKITDRKKDLIKTAGGKYVAPQKLENLLKLHPIISYVLIHGDQKKYIVALVTLNKQLVYEIAKEKNIISDNYQQLVEHPEIQGVVKKAFSETNSQLASYESIKKFTILLNEFTVEGGELTPSLKVKRKFLDKKFQDKIEALYR